ncbi:hypothetical protein PS2_036308 [Malus domestica]
MKAILPYGIHQFKSSRRYPPHGFDQPTDLTLGRPCYGFGYDFANDDYKFVKIVEFLDGDGVITGAQVKVYSLKSNSWKRIQNMSTNGFGFDSKNILFLKERHRSLCPFTSIEEEISGSEGFLDLAVNGTEDDQIGELVYVTCVTRVNLQVELQTKGHHTELQELVQKCTPTGPMPVEGFSSFIGGNARNNKNEANCHDELNHKWLQWELFVQSGFGSH